jgi:glycosyltransferase involved in cell wall biosynthesis
VRIALVSSFVPFVYGGGRNIVEWLAPHLRANGDEVEIIYLPFTGEPDKMFAQLAAFRTIDLTDRADVVICFRPPSHLIRHPRKVLWFIHHFRSYYDLWDTTYSEVPNTAEHRSRRDSLRIIDNRAFAEASRIFTNSLVVGARLRAFNGVESEVLYPPVLDPERFHDAGAGNAVVYLSRLEHHKRQHLAIEAMSYTKSPVSLEVIGTASMSTYSDELRELVARRNLENRVTVADRWISEHEKVEILSRSLAVAYFPLDEDSYGYPSIEGSLSGKPILTTTDSGGVMELVRDGGNGLVVRPTPEDIARAMDQLFLDRKASARMGVAARERLDELGINWDTVVARILS